MRLVKRMQLKQALACVAIAVAAPLAAEAQIVISTIEGMGRCPAFKVTNTTNHAWQIYVSYTVTGQDIYGQRAVTTHETPIYVNPNYTHVENLLYTGGVSCDKQWNVSAVHWRGEDRTAIQEANEKRINDSREAVIRQYLENEEAKKQKAAEYQRQREAEAAARAQKEADRVARAEASKRALEEAQRQQQAYQNDQRRAIMANSDPRCRFFDWDSYQRNYQSCLNSYRLEDAKQKQAALDAQRQAEAADRGRQLNAQVMQMTASISPSNGCQTPQYQTAGIPEAQAGQMQIAIHNAWQQCMQIKAGQDAQRVAAENAQRDALIQHQALLQQQQAQFEAEQRAQAQAQQQAMFEAQQRAEAQAQVQAQLAAAVRDAEASNDSLRATSRSIQSDNAALEAFLRGN